MPSSRNRDWSRVSGDPETGANPDLWDPELVKTAGTWAIVMGALGVFGSVVSVTVLRDHPIERDLMFLITTSVAVVIAFLSLYYGFRLRTPGKESEFYLTVLIWLYSLLLAMSIAEGIYLAVEFDGDFGLGIFRYLLLGLAIRAFVRGKQAMVDFPGSGKSIGPE